MTSYTRSNVWDIAYSYSFKITYFSIQVFTAWFLLVFLFAFVLLWFYSTGSTTFGKYRFLLIDVMISFLVWLVAVDAGNIQQYLFKTNGYYGVIDELDAGKQGTIMIYFNDIRSVLTLWSIMYFCCVSTLLSIKLHRESRINGTYMNQLSMTISSIFAGLLDYGTDLLLIFYWIKSGLYVFVSIELFFILYGQFVASKLINHVKDYCTFDNENNEDDTQDNYNDNDQKIKVKWSWVDIIIKCIFALGFSRIYHSVKTWENDKYIEYEYKWSKLWEIMFESIPSVILSSYITLMELAGNSSDVTAVIVSMFFSFISITNTIVTILNKDRINTNTTESPIAGIKPTSEQIMNQVISIGSKSNDKSSGIGDDLKSLNTDMHTQLWIENESSGEICFFAETPKPKTESTSNHGILHSCQRKLNTLLILIIHFDIKMKNFVIWLFLTTDLFLKCVSIIGNVVVVNFLFADNATNETINFKNIGIAQAF